MKNPNDRIKTPGAEGPPDGAAAPQTQEPTEPQAPAPKPPPPLPLFFMLSHLEEDGPVRLDGVKLGVCEVMGLEIDEPKLGAFAGALNACDFPVQLLIRQHPPRLGGLREELREAQPQDLPPQTRAAAESLRRLLTELEARDGILDRRFYAVCEFGRFDELRGLLARAGLSVHPFSGRRLRMLMLASALGGTPAEMDEETPVEVEMRRREVRVGDRLVRSLHLGKWPRSLAPGFLQSLMTAGAPMDLSIHLGSIPAEQAARTLEWQKVRFESAQSLSFKRGRTMSPEAEIALEDVTRLRDEVQRGRERLFHASLSITLHAKDEASLKEMTQRAKAHFAATLGKLDPLAFRQREGILSTLPLALNAVAEWRTLDTSSIARLFPFSPPDLDTRRGTLYGIDMRACAPVVYDPWDGTHLNANTAVLARSGSGKSFATKLGMLRGLTRGVTAYVIDPEGEYADMARAAGGRVLSPGIPGQGMNPFVIDKGDSEELLQRIGSLRRLIEVMVGESLGAERRASLDHALAGYYAQPRERTGFRDFYEYLQGDEAGGKDMARLLRPFATGSLRNLLSDEGDDLLSNEALITVFDLRLLEPDLSSPKKQRHTAKRIYERLRDEHGFPGKYTIVKDYVRERRRHTREMFLPLSHPPGHAQCDYGEARVIIGGVERKAHYFALDLPHSDGCYVKAYPAEMTESFCDGHVSAFAFLGGVPQSILYDNTTLAVARILGDGRRQRTRVFSELQSHYLFEDRFGRPGKGNDKGKVEGLVGYVRRNFLVPIPSFESFDALNAHLEQHCLRRFEDRLRGHNETIGERLERDLEKLLPLPAVPYDASDKHATRVSSLSLVRYRTNDYSVPVAYGHRDVLVRGYVHEVAISCGAEVIARHRRSYDRDDFVFDPLHYLPLLEKKTRALDQAAPLVGWELPEEFGVLRRLLESRMGKRGKREFVQVLRLMENFQPEEVHDAVRDAIRLGAVSFDAVKHLVLCRIEGRPPRLDMELYPYLPRTNVATTSTRDYMALLAGSRS